MCSDVDETRRAASASRYTKRLSARRLKFGECDRHPLVRRLIGGGNASREAAAADHESADFTIATRLVASSDPTMSSFLISLSLSWTFCLLNRYRSSANQQFGRRLISLPNQLDAACLSVTLTHTLTYTSRRRQGT